MAWSQNNRACTTTWSTLFALEQSVRPFPDSGSVKMQEMTYWTTAVGDPIRQLRAQALAMRIDAIFRVTRGAVYEDGSGVDQAVTQMCEVFADGEATMERLADVNDANYRFWQEG